jgi:Flp pilus assembly protein TadG
MINKSRASFSCMRFSEIALKGRSSCLYRNDFHKQGAQSGQMTIEFVVCFPVMLVVALIAINALLFFSECASFDRNFREATVSYASSPSYGQTVDNSCAKIKTSIEKVCNGDLVSVDVASSGIEGGLVTFTGTLSFTPTLFGAGSLSSAFGVSFPRLTHQNQIVVDCYKPGVVI